MSATDIIWVLLGFTAGLNVGAWAMGLINHALIAEQRKLIKAQDAAIAMRERLLGMSR